MACSKVSVLWTALLVLAAASAAAQAPDEDWRVFDTEHFRITYPLRLRGLAVRVAVYSVLFFMVLVYGVFGKDVIYFAF